MSLADKECVPCRGGVPPLTGERARALLTELGGRWNLNPALHLECSYRFANFVDAMDFAHCVADIAEEQNHHPDLHIGWGRCGVEIWTHAISGLTESDYFLAAKIERAFQSLK